MRRVIWAAVLAVLLIAVPGARAADRFSLVHGCYVVKAGHKAVADGQPFRMQATDLGIYLLYGKNRDFFGSAGMAAQPSPDTEWRVEEAGDEFTLTNLASGQKLKLGDAERFRFEKADGCPAYPESEVGADGTPAEGATPYGHTSGVLDAHLHLMAFEFIGGSVRCGRPWHRYGIPFAMVDCPDHGPGGAGAALEGVLSHGNPISPHDTVGWPTFKDWPAWDSLTHEQVYYKWLERAWKGGLRITVDLLVDNAILCEVYPLKRNPCDEMATARLELKRTRELQDYIDAQSGGPGKGWFRIVTDPFEARRVVNQGKLAVVIGMETSRLFDCTVYNEVPRCDRATIDGYLDEFYGLGVRSLQLINKFDNAFGGVAGDSGVTGLVTNNGNKLETNRFLRMATCVGPDAEHVHDEPQPTVSGEDALAAGILQTFLPLGTTPMYGPAPHCNQLGLSELGDYLLRQAMQKHVLLDPDHLSVLARQRFLDVVESARYPGVLSSHSWSTPDAFPRIYGLGGTIAPAGDSVKRFIKDWRDHKAVSNPKWEFGFGYGSDTNGFSKNPPPRDDVDKNPLEYPFKSRDGKVTFTKQRAGEREWDLNVDGGAHYGLYADWLADVNLVGGEEMTRDVFNSAEAYLQMWERTVGVPAPSCGSAHERVTRNGLGDVRLGAPIEDLLRGAGQPRTRPGRAWSYCVRGKGNAKAKVAAVVGAGERVGLVASTARSHRAGARLHGTRPFGAGVRVRRAGRRAVFVYGVRKGRVDYVAVATPRVAKSPKRLRTYLKLAGL